MSKLIPIRGYVLKNKETGFFIDCGGPLTPINIKESPTYYWKSIPEAEKWCRFILGFDSSANDEKYRTIHKDNIKKLEQFDIVEIEFSCESKKIIRTIEQLRLIEEFTNTCENLNISDFFIRHMAKSPKFDDVKIVFLTRKMDLSKLKQLKVKKQHYIKSGNHIAFFDSEMALKAKLLLDVYHTYNIKE